MSNQIRRGQAVQGRWPGLAGLAALILAPAALAGCSSSPGPLIASLIQKGVITCQPEPDPSAGITSWDAPIGFAENYFYNRGDDAVTIKSVSLIDAHNLTLRTAIAYRITQSTLPVAWPWATLAKKADPTQWQRRQAVPGATIQPARSGSSAPGPRSGKLYEILAVISAKSPKGGWTSGLQVTYQANNSTYTVRAYIGYAISSPPANSPTYCRSYYNAIGQAWKTIS